MSKVFKPVLDDLTVSHVTSSAYHPQSQGALERFHQTLKTMLKTHCVDSGRDWAEKSSFAYVRYQRVCTRFSWV